MSKEQAPNLSPWNNVTVGNSSRRYKSKPESELDLPGFRVVEPVNNLFAAAVEF